MANPLSFGKLTLETSITTASPADTHKILATTIASPFKLFENGTDRLRSDLAGIAALSAAAAIGTGYSFGDKGATPLFATTESSFKSDPLTAIITFRTSNDSSSDTWLRTDGSNSMHAKLRFDSTDSESREIIGVSRVQNLANHVLFLGDGSGMTPSSSAAVVVDADAEVMGDFLVRNDLTANGTITGNSVSARTGSFSQSITSDQGHFTGIVDAKALVSSHQVQGSVFIDSDDNTYQVDPSGTSTLRDLRVQNSGNIRYLSTEEASVQSALSVEGYIYLKGLATLGGSCLTNGQMGSDTNGKILSCQNGRWTGNTFDISQCGIGESGSLLWPRTGMSSDTWVTSGAVKWHVNNLPMGQVIGAPVNPTQYQCMPYLWASSMYAMCCPK